MDPVLETLVFEGLAESTLDERAQDLVLAACGGAAELAQAIDGVAPTRPPAAEQLDLQTRDLGVYLTSIKVRGFRGIGPAVTLDVTPGPGLTLVAGRNGSGKSSFAEGFELLLTGANSRWLGRTKVWTEGWRNLHEGSQPTLEARLHVEGEPGTTVLSRTWGADDGLTDGEFQVVDGAGATASLDSLGWTQAISRYRPFLSFNELGQMFDKLGTMYDALSAILGLEDVDLLAAHLRDARLARDRLVKASRDEAAGLTAALAAIDDDRARAVLAAIEAKPVDLDAIELELEGLGEAATGDLGVLRSLATFSPPTLDQLDVRLGDLDAAAAEFDAVASTDAGRARGLAQLLSAALAHREQHAFEACPVCGTEGAIGSDWAPRTSAEVLRLGQEASAADKAVAAEQAARRRVAELLGPHPPVFLGAARDLGLDPGPAEQAWSRWGDERDHLDDPASHARLRETVDLLGAAATAIRDAATAELDRREDAWRPVGRKVAAWLPGARTAVEADGARKPLKAAEDWIKATAADLRTARLAPIADAAIANWELLRRESNVSLEGFELRRSGNTKMAEVDVRVDGTDASAFGVMSQGELHALAVSVFLPRATLPESPFRFVVIDDPVQSMDPAKVDGLARALARSAETRQVIVFTHDERLPEAARRLGLEATALEVTRHPSSVVEVRVSLTPVERYLADARALVRSEDVPREVAERVVPGFCRHAIEAACTQVIRRRRIDRGDVHAQVEAELSKATTLYMFLSLALFDEAGRGGDVLTTINNRFGSKSADAIRAVNKGVHETLGIDLRDLVRDSATFARQLAEAK